jgi:glutamine amidotransferase-like uncharacterized protein
LRLGDNTELELIKNDSNNFKIDLIKGQVWANINNLNLDVKTGPAIASVNNSVVNITREEGKTVLSGIKYNTKVAFFDNNNNYLNRLYLSVFNQITVTDSAITSAYGQLKLSKLKKELRMTHLSTAEIKKEEWFADNLLADITFTGGGTNLAGEKYTNVCFAQFASTLKNSLTHLTFNENKNQAHYLQRLQELYKNAFYFASLEETDKAKLNLAKIDQLV